MPMDFLLMVAVIAECVENLGQPQMGQSTRGGLRCQTLSPELYDRPDRRARSLDNRFTTEDLIVSDDVPMSRCLNHGKSASLFLETIRNVLLSPRMGAAGCSLGRQPQDPATPPNPTSFHPGRRPNSGLSPELGRRPGRK